jgi:hypothetical protein
VSEYFRRSGGWSTPQVELRTPPGTAGDPLYAVWARRELSPEPKDQPGSGAVAL